MISLTPVQWLITKSVGYMIDNSSDLNWNHLMKNKLLLQLNIKTIWRSIFNFEWKIFLFSIIIWSSWENCTKNQSYICDRLNMIFVFLSLGKNGNAWFSWYQRSSGMKFILFFKDFLKSWMDMKNLSQIWLYHKNNTRACVVSKW